MKRVRVLGLLISFAPMLLMAQEHPTATSSSRMQQTGGADLSGFGAIPGLPATPADTGWMTPGWRDFRRYDWIVPGGMCAAAVPAATALLWRSGSRDTLTYTTVIRDSLPMPARTIAQRCGERVLAAAAPTIGAKTSAMVFLPLLQLALDLQRVDTARAMLARYLPHVRDPQERLFVLSTVLNIAEQTHPLQLALVEDAVVQLDSLGNASEVIPARGYGHIFLLNHWENLGDTARQHMEIESTLPLQRLWPAHPTAPYRFREMWETLFHWIVLADGPKSPRIKEWIQRYSRMRDDGQEALRVSYLSGLYGGMLRLYGTPFQAPDSATVWYRPVAGGSHAVDTTTAGLVPGRLSLVWRVDQNCGDRCYPIYQVLRHIQEKYGPKGLDLVLVAKTAGYAPEIAGSVSAAAEASAVRRYFQDYLKLRATVVVEPTSYRRIPDGRRVDEPTPWERHYQYELPVIGPAFRRSFLVDQQGIVRGVDLGGVGITGNPEHLLDLYITKYLKP